MGSNLLKELIRGWRLVMLKRSFSDLGRLKKIGKMCVPALNMKECLKVDNINLITCGGQAAIPIIEAIMKVHPATEYIELVSSIASKFAGSGIRMNIDEFTQTTRDAIDKFTGVKKAKAIIILNPAEPLVLMHNTIYAKIKQPDLRKDMGISGRRFVKEKFSKERLIKDVESLYLA